MGKSVGTNVLCSSILSYYIILYYARAREKWRFVCNVRVQYARYYIILYLGTTIVSFHIVWGHVQNRSKNQYDIWIWGKNVCPQHHK